MRKKRIEAIHKILIAVIIVCAGLLLLGFDGEIKALFVTNTIYLITDLRKRRN